MVIALKCHEYRAKVLITLRILSSTLEALSENSIPRVLCSADDPMDVEAGGRQHRKNALPATRVCGFAAQCRAVPRPFCREALAVDD